MRHVRGDHDDPALGHRIVQAVASPLRHLRSLGTDATVRWLRACWPMRQASVTGRNPLRAVPSMVAAGGFATGKQGRARAGSAASQELREKLLETAAALRFYVIVLEAKGGVGKSVCSMTAYETLKLTAEGVLLLDADIVNRNLSRAGLTEESAALNAGRVDFEGFLFEAAERLISGEVGGVVIDSAAGREDAFNPFLPELAALLRDNGVRLVVMRPVTTSPLVHDNIVSFARTVMTPDMGVLLVRNMGQGRSSEDFVEFDASSERAEMLERGMVECVLDSAGARYSDLATSFGCSFAQIALKETDELGLDGRNLIVAKRVFTRPVRLFLARWLLRQTTSIRAGLIESVLRTLT